ncbi:hypothetical protein CLOM_g7380 [Closterium sp. NIES-68]|nr:hypothetical protein CLOM_g7380 [Closterium sp. NIES-68]GJP85214.1 hypothetical protein CLOP_g15339 [Closterium sp. NIES-67]
MNLISRPGLLRCVLLAAIVAGAAARIVTVGEADVGGYGYGWNPSVNYTKWAAETPLRPGDILVFEYPKRAEVVYRVGSTTDLTSCHLKGAQVLCDSLRGSRPGKDGAASACAVTVESGPMYITSIKTHCQQGQQLVVEPIIDDTAAGDGDSGDAAAVVNPPVVGDVVNDGTTAGEGADGENGSGTQAAEEKGAAEKLAEAAVNQAGPAANHTEPAANGVRLAGTLSHGPIGNVSTEDSSVPLPSPPGSPSVAPLSNAGAGNADSNAGGNAVVPRLATTQASGRSIVVGNPTPSYNYPFNPQVNYNSWVAKSKLYDGDVILFKYPNYHQEVVQFARYGDYRSCNFRAAKVVCYDSWGSKSGCAIKVTRTMAYYASGLYGNCLAGQKVAVKANAKPYTPRTLAVGYPSQQFKWNWNPNGQFDKWLQYNKVYTGDTVVFKYPPYKDEVFIVPSLTDYRNCDYSNYISYCNSTDGAGAGCYSNPITATTYFISGIFSHCMKDNQRIVITPQKPPS